MIPEQTSELLESSMETAGDRRRRKLKVLCDSLGRPAVAEAAGKSPIYLEQIIKGVLLPQKRDGTRSPRNLGDAAARAIERAFQLGEGWFDAPDDSGDLSHEARTVAEFFDRAPPEVQQMMMRMAVPVGVDIVIDSSHIGGTITGLGELDAIPAKKKGDK